MQTTINQAIAANYTASVKKVSALQRFTQWTVKQEENRYGWVAGILAIHGCVLTPITILIVAFTGMNFALFMTGMVAMGLALSTNLAAMPTKVTIPAFLLSVLIDVLVILACFFI